MNEEIWKKVKDFDWYEVSSLGRIRSHARGFPLILKPIQDTKGYYFVVLSQKIGRKKVSFRVHRLIADAFVPCVDDKDNLDVHHIDGNKKNNHPSNLEWKTRAENLSDAYLKGLRRKGWIAQGEASPNTNLTEGQVKEIRYSNSYGMSRKKLAEKFGVSLAAIHDIVRRRTWRHI